MDENKTPEVNEEEINDLDNIVVLTDQNGKDIEFEFLDIVESNGNQYVVLLPVEDAEKGEVAICRIEGEGDDETYVGVEDEEEAERVFNAFKEQAKDDFDFVD